MKVFNLCCDQDHAFEGWFASAQAFDDQLGSGLLECPLCGSHEVVKTPSAPRLNLGAIEPAAAKEPVAMTNDAAMRAALIGIARTIAANSEDVGERFPDEARAIHYDEAPKRSIRGVASKDEAAELVDEGIEVVPLPFGHLLKNPVQ
jgi:hypothetical protein